MCKVLSQENATPYNANDAISTNIFSPECKFVTQAHCVRLNPETRGASGGLDDTSLNDAGLFESED